MRRCECCFGHDFCVDVFGITGIAMNNLAISYGKLEMHADALALLEKALAIRLRVLPEDHPDICDLIFRCIAIVV
jgi:hypothetical protein